MMSTGNCLGQRDLCLGGFPDEPILESQALLDGYRHTIFGSIEQRRKHPDRLNRKSAESQTLHKASNSMHTRKLSSEGSSTLAAPHYNTLAW